MVNFYSKKYLYYNPQTNTIYVVRNAPFYFEYEGLGYIEPRNISPEKLGYYLIGEL